MIHILLFPCPEVVCHFATNILKKDFGHFLEIPSTQHRASVNKAKTNNDQHATRPVIKRIRPSNDGWPYQFGQQMMPERDENM